MRSTTKVTAAASNHNLIALSDLKLELNITDSNSDTRLNNIIEQASEFVENTTGRVWVSEGIEQKFYFSFWENIPTLILERRPISVINSITENGVVLTENTDYSVDARRGMLYRINYLGFLSGVIGAPSVIVDYAGGFNLSGSPPDKLPGGLVRATLTLAKAYWFSGPRDPNIRSETTFGIDSVTYRDATDAEKAVADMLSAYTDPVRA